MAASSWMPRQGRILGGEDVDKPSNLGVIQVIHNIHVIMYMFISQTNTNGKNGGLAIKLMTGKYCQLTLMDV